MRQLLYDQEYPVSKDDIIKKVFDREASVERFVAHLHGLSQIPVCPKYTDDIITSCTWLNILLIYNNTMVGAVQFMVYVQGVHFNEKKYL